MSYWVSSICHFYGNDHELKDLAEKVRNIAQESWLGDLVKALGISTEDKFLHGKFWHEPPTPTELTIETETDFQPEIGFFDLIKSHYKSLRFAFFAEGEGSDAFWTNDRTGLYFPDRWVTSWSDGTEIETHYHTTKEEAFQYISEMAGKQVKSKKDIKRIHKSLLKKDGFCRLYEVEVI